MCEHVVVDHLFSIRLKLVAFDGLKEWTYEVVLHPGLGTRKISVRVELRGFLDVLLESAKLDPKCLDGIPQNKMNCVACD